MSCGLPSCACCMASCLRHADAWPALLESRGHGHPGGLLLLAFENPSAFARICSLRAVRPGASRWFSGLAYSIPLPVANNFRCPGAWKLAVGPQNLKLLSLQT